MTITIESMSTAPTRAERALATRRRMVRAAYGLFCQQFDRWREPP